MIFPHNPPQFPKNIFPNLKKVVFIDKLVLTYHDCVQFFLPISGLHSRRLMHFYAFCRQNPSKTDHSKLSDSLNTHAKCINSRFHYKRVFFFIKFIRN